MHDSEKHARIYVYVNCPFNVPGIDMMTTIIDSGTFYVFALSPLLLTSCNIPLCLLFVEEFYDFIAKKFLVHFYVKEESTNK